MPVIRPISDQILIINQRYSGSFTITGAVTSVSVEGLLEGFVYSFDTSISVNNLTISGTPTTLRSTRQIWSVKAKNGVPEASQDIGYTVVELQPAITSISSRTFFQGSSVNIPITISNKPTSVDVRGPLMGLTFSSENNVHRITGRVDRNANFTITRDTIDIIASNTGGKDTFNIDFGFNSAPSLSFAIPRQTIRLTVEFILDVSQHFAGHPFPVFTAQNLPAGLSITGRGIISGTPTRVQNITTTITAINNRSSIAASASISFIVLPLAEDPELRDIPTQQLNIGSSYNYRVRADGEPPPTFSAVGLPAGLSINRVTGVISGTPTTQQTYNVVITASNVHPETGATHIDTATVSFVVSPRLTVPVIIDITNKTFVAGTPIIPFTVSTTLETYPSATFIADRLPDGININAQSGVISGTPTRRNQGINNVTITATNQNGNHRYSFTMTINAIPILNDSTVIDRTFVAQSSISSFTIVSDAYPTPTYTATGIPDGISLSEDGEFTGTPTRINYGENTINITATNAAGVDSDSFYITINTIPVFNTINDFTFLAGTAITPFTISTTEDTYPTASFREMDIPSGIVLDVNTREVSGTPERTDAGTNDVTFIATNIEGSDFETVDITINTIPIIPNIPLQGLAVNNVYNETFMIDSFPVSSITVENLPDGLSDSISGNALTISGNPITIQMPEVTITATNSVGMDTHSVIFNVGAAFTVPVIANIPAQTLTSGTAFSYTATSTANPTASYSATNLPDGIVLNETTGEITGTPTRVNIGPNTIRITATNHQGSVFQDVVFTVNAIPIFNEINDQNIYSRYRDHINSLLSVESYPCINIFRQIYLMV